MKLLKSIVLLALLMNISCKDNSTDIEIHYKSNGVITGYDFRECMCCGGMFIEINDSTYRFWEFPKESNINQNNIEFPLNVSLDWSKKDSACMPDLIDVIRIRKR